MIPSRVCASIVAFRSTRPCLALHHGTRNWATNSVFGTDDNNALAVTDPLLVYQSKVARGELDEDEEQVRALVKLRDLTRRLQDYTPPAHLLGILNSSGLSGRGSKIEDEEQRKGDVQKQQQQLVRYLTTQQTLADLDTPRGLLLTGPPGTGKSMVLDIWFDSLPMRGKFRRHYHHLLLTLYRVIWLEAEKRRQALRGGAPPQPTATSDKDLEWGRHASSGPRRAVMPERGTGVVWERGGQHGVRADGKGSGWRRVLRGMPFFRADSLSDSDGQGAMTENEMLYQEATANLANASSTTLPLHAAAQLFLNYGPVMLFDEVQLVDIASAGLLKRTLEAYWLLGGVVVGSSNRLPEDLYNNGVQQSQLVQFFEALKNRCPVHEMRGERDFRKAPGGLDFWKALEGSDKSSSTASQAPDDSQSMAKTTYFVRGQDGAFDQRLAELVGTRQPTATILKVYNRPLHIPLAYPPTETDISVALFSFPELCDSPLGPADYLTIVSHFEAIVVRDVPQLLLANKNQARRWITFIDAAYESGTRLLIMAASGPDDLFFPEARNERRRSRVSVRPPSQSAEPDDVVDMSARGAKSPFLTPAPGKSYPDEEQLARQRRQDAKEEELDDDEQWSAQDFTSADLIQSETLSEARQDVEEGFRPNISSYVDVSAGASPGRSTSIEEKRKAEAEKRRQAAEKRRLKEETVVGFPDLAIFSGADERFSYARAVSRLHEMSNPMWKQRKQWTPLLESEMRLWGVGEERPAPATTTTTTTTTTTAKDGSSSTKTTSSMTQHAAREPNAALEAMSDFADEASYEASTFPSRTSSYRDNPAGVSSNQDGDWHNRGGPVAHNLPRTSRFQSRTARPLSDEEEAQLQREPYEGERGASSYYDDSSESPPSSRDSGPPRFSTAHAWGMTDWGPKAGRWGQGTRVFEEERGGDGNGGESAPQARDGESFIGDEEEEALRVRRARLKRERTQRMRMVQQDQEQRRRDS
ncbi:unnamed protein product [Jaminaea pallidilutea]